MHYTHKGTGDLIMFQLRKYLIALIALLVALTSLAVKADDSVFATVAVNSHDVAYYYSGKRPLRNYNHYHGYRRHGGYHGYYGFRRHGGYHGYHRYRRHGGYHGYYGFRRHGGFHGYHRFRGYHK